MQIKSLSFALACAFTLAACNNGNNTQQTTTPAASQTAPTSSSAPAASSASATPAASAASNGIVSTDISKDNIGGDFTLTDGKGKPFSLSSLKGKVAILAFGFTNCPDVCPTELFVYSEAIQQLGEQGKDVEVVFVSVDPERDTPDLIGRYAAQFNPKFIGLTDSNGGRDIALIKQQYRIVSAKTEIKSDKLYNVDHTSGAYLIDKEGNAAYFAPYGIEAPQLAEDLKKLLNK
ncbi:SCO family protein [Neisseriaceae bacterium B1]